MITILLLTSSVASMPGPRSASCMGRSLPGSSFAICGGRGWDPVDGVLDGPVVVLIDDGVIVDVIERCGTLPTDVPTVDLGRGATLLPGLVDCHVHLCWDPDADHVSDFASVEDASLTGRVWQACRKLLAAGITTVRDLGDRGYVTLACRDHIAHQPELGPEIVAAGPPITTRHGHCWFLGGETTASAIRTAVAARADHNVDVIKIMATGGKITSGRAPHESQFDLTTLARAVRAARGRALPVTAHAHGPAGIRDAVAAGVDGIEHCTFLTADTVDCDWTIVDRIAAAGIHVSAPEATWSDQLPLPPDGRLAEVWANLVRMHRAGVQLSISSDSGISARKPHGVLAHGAIRLAAAGLSNHDALVAITATPAAACGLADRKGRLAPGREADVVAFRGDPTVDLTALLHPVRVFRRGRAIRVARASGENPQPEETHA